MVINRHVLIKLSVVFTFLSCQSQKTKNPLIKKLENSIYEIETLTNISDLSFSLSSGEDSTFDPSDKHNFKEEKQQKSNAEINRFIDSLRVNQTIIYPYSLIEIDFSNSDLIDLQGLNSFYFHNKPNEVPVFKPLKVEFLDASKISTKNVIISADSINKRYYNDETLSKVDEILNELHTPFKKHFLITESKPVKSIQFEFIRFEKNRTSHTLKNKGENVKTKYGNIYLESINDKTLTLRVPTVIADDLNIKALYKDGRVLESTGASSSTYLSDKKRAFLKEYVSVLEKAKVEVEKNKITTEVQLDEYLVKQSPEVIEEIEYAIKNYTFKGPIDYVKLTVSDTLMQSNLHTTTYNFNDADVFVATDFETQKKGLVDKSGNWVAKPKYSSSFRKVNEHFFRDQLSYGGYDSRDYDDYYLYNSKNKTLNKFNYQLDEIIVYDNKYVKIEAKTNGPIGLFDITKGIVTIPLKHSWLNYYAPNIWIGRDEENNRIGAYLSSGKQILPHKFNTVEYNNGFLYTIIEDAGQDNRDLKDIYNTNGKNITQGKYNDIEDSFNNGLQLVVKHKFKVEESITSIIGSDYFFIDKNGKEVLSFLDKYGYFVEPFENGLSRVRNINKKDRNYGFINTKRKVVIPYMYDDASDFLGDYAYVKYKKGSDSWIGFIDKNNKRILELPDYKRHIWYHKELKKHLIKTYDDSVYDFYGNKINFK